MFSRRTLLAGGALAGLGAAAGVYNWRRAYRRKLAPPLDLVPGKTSPLHLAAAERPQSLPCFGGKTLPMWTFSDGVWPPVIRLALGEQLDVTLDNRLPRPEESTSIHWHGCRLPNAQDGVPYLVQKPVMPGGSFRYTFMPPDTGTFFFHTHCNTAEQLGRGLQGVLIVEGDTTESYDADHVLFLRDWHVDVESGQFTPFTTARGSGRAGTYGRVRSVNGAVDPLIELPSSGDCRLRIINGDPTRIMRLAVEGAEAGILAIDGFAVPPMPFEGWTLAPAMRIDLVMRAPVAGQTAYLIDEGLGGRVVLAHFSGAGEPVRSDSFDPAPLHAARVPDPDLANAERLTFAFDRTDDGKAIAQAMEYLPDVIGALCLSTNEFWSIGGQVWPTDGHARLPAPIARLELGKSYIFTLKNLSPFAHPIHIHGHTFRLLDSSHLKRPEHHTDTLLLMPEETAEVAFVADNPGKWMFHCHIIEHQEAGMMVYLDVA